MATLSNTDTVLKPYFESRGYITLCRDLLTFQNRVIIPQTERLETLRNIHEGHLGMTKCTEKARLSVWWPRMSQDIEEMIRNCNTCKTSAPTVKEPLLPTATPTRPWQMLGTDLFVHKGKHYLLVTDYYSRYPELAELSSENSKCVIEKMKCIFARHGLPELVISDNGPQYSSEEFKQFAQAYGFQSVTSSPKYPRANGAAERMIKTIKNILKKSTDPYLGLLAYRTSPIHGGLSPAELLMGRRLRNSVVQLDYPITTDEDHKNFQSSNNIFKVKMKDNHDNKHVRELPTLRKGSDVYVRDLKRYGTVKEVLPGRTYIVDAGRELRRNRSGLVNTPTEHSDNRLSKTDSDITPTPTVSNEATPVVDTPRYSRPHREIRPPRRLIEEC